MSLTKTVQAVGRWNWVRGAALGLAAAAMVVGVAAPASAAITLSWDVNVTSRTGGSGVFTPFSFVQTWTFGGLPQTETNGNCATSCIVRNIVYNAPANSNNSPRDNEVLTTANLPDFGTGLFTISNDAYFTNGVNSFSSQNMNLSKQKLVETQLSPGQKRVQQAYEAMNRSASLPLPPGPMDDAAILSFIETVGALQWRSYGTDYVVNTQTQQLVSSNSVYYQGIATLRTVPEPQSWALLLMGFGGLGAALRRRRHARLNAEAATQLW